MFTWYFEYSRVCFLVIYALTLDAWLYDVSTFPFMLFTIRMWYLSWRYWMSWLYDVSFMLCILYDVVSIWLDDDIIIDWSIYAIISLA